MIVEIIVPGIPIDESAARTLGQLAADGARFVSPGLLPLEVRNVLLTGIRRGRWDGVLADQAEANLADLPVEIIDDARDGARAWELARRYDNHPVYDMVYVALAERLAARLLTQDQRLLRRLAGLDWVVSPSQVANHEIERTRDSPEIDT